MLASVCGFFVDVVVSVVRAHSVVLSITREAIMLAMNRMFLWNIKWYFIAMPSPRETNGQAWAGTCFTRKCSLEGGV